MSVMVALVGAQPLPNLFPVRQDKPDGVLLVYTQRTQKVAERLSATLERETQVFEVKTDPYDIPTITATLDERIKRNDLAGVSLVFNVTGGTKAMALAAYQIAQQRDSPVLYLESEGKQTHIYRYVWRAGQLQAVGNEIVPACITTEDFLNVSLGPGVWQITGPQRQEGAPFEIALAAMLNRHGYETHIGVKAYGQLDIDVLVRCENQFAIIEAKAGENGRRLDGLKQLRTAGAHLGLYTQQCYVITVPPSQSHTAIVEASNVQVVSLPGYIAGATSLMPEDEQILVEAITKILKV